MSSSLEEEMRSNAVDEHIRKNQMREKKIEKKRRRRKALTVLIVIALILIIGGVFVNQYVIGPIKQKAAKELAVTAVEQALEKAGVSDDVKSQAEQIVNSMSEEDQEKIESIINNHSNPAQAAKALQIYQSEGVSGLKSYARGILSTEEQKELESLYDKYKDSIY
jgi:cytoskeletal protein RodZ